MSVDKRENEFISYNDVVAHFKNDMPLIVQIKRLVECMTGDPEFRTELLADSSSEKVRTRLNEIGVELDPKVLQPLWDLENAGKVKDGQLPVINEKILKEYPEMKLWLSWQEAMLKLKTCCFTSDASRNKRFEKWQQRRIQSVKSELGFFANYIDHPLFAIELAKGCSIGCWFCGFSAEKLSAVFDYNEENLELFRTVVKDGVDLFGNGAAATLCYYATEPHDNPHYIDFLREFKSITGSTLCTATAAPVHDPEWTRELIEFYREGPFQWPRFSVLSTATLKRIHETYSPDELRDVHVLMQTKDSKSIKAKSGRILNDEDATLSGLELSENDSYIPQGSIACVTGFLINLIDKTVKLISPCYSSEKWPYGYRIFAEENFNGKDDYKKVLLRIIENNIAEHIETHNILAFRDDLKYTLTDDGFELLSPNKKHKIKGKPHHRLLGNLIMEGTHTYSQVFDRLKAHGTFDIQIIKSINLLFNRGLLDETVLQPCKKV